MDMVDIKGKDSRVCMCLCVYVGVGGCMCKHQLSVCIKPQSVLF